MGELIEIGGFTQLDIDPDKVLKKAVGELDSVIISGKGKDGKIWAASSLASGPDALWLVERFKQILFQAEL